MPEGQGTVGEMQETGMDLTVEGSCSRAPNWVHEDLLCRSYVGESTTAPQSDQGWHRQDAGTQVVGGQPLLKSPLSPSYVQRSCEGFLRKDMAKVHFLVSG